MNQSDQDVGLVLKLCGFGAKGVESREHSIGAEEARRSKVWGDIFHQHAHYADAQPVTIEDDIAGFCKEATVFIEEVCSKYRVACCGKKIVNPLVAVIELVVPEYEGVSFQWAENFKNGKTTEDCAYRRALNVVTPIEKDAAWAVFAFLLDCSGKVGSSTDPFVGRREARVKVVEVEDG